MKKKILNNWGLKLWSLVLAAILWFVVVQVNDPKDSKTFSNVKVQITNADVLESQKKVYEILDNSDIVSVTIRAPKSIIGQIRYSDIIAEADMNKLTDINTIAISYSILNVDSDYVIVGKHDSVKLSVDEKAAKWIGVDYGTIGEVADGYIVSNVYPDQTTIEVSGPKALIDTVDKAYVQLDVSGAASTRSANVEIAIYDKEGQILNQNSIKKNVEQIHVVAEVLGTKTVPIEYNYSGEAENGYMVTGEVEADRTEVRLAGTATALSTVNKIVIPAESINISGSTEDFVTTINLRDYIPDNIKIAETSFNGKIEVTVHIEEVAEEDLTILSKDVRINNIPYGYSVKPANEDDKLVIGISGLDADVKAVLNQKVSASVDIKQWMNDEEISELKEGIISIPLSTNISTEKLTYEDVYFKVEVVKNN